MIMQYSNRPCNRLLTNIPILLISHLSVRKKSQSKLTRVFQAPTTANLSAVSPICCIAQCTVKQHQAVESSPCAQTWEHLWPLVFRPLMHISLLTGIPSTPCDITLYARCSAAWCQLYRALVDAENEKWEGKLSIF
ncbi:hypothetical protein GDO86_011784 [Hymenochirus boettgeri]|uniref:Uncharacterized protein n=1 Tax=Hymenochirus boettgeri TaxID=247094 RepID=A0A8T2JCV4_9PIPI|nr:hypothetical protein GDO86_011784 [Hymenochirus boettgeri]